MAIILGTLIGLGIFLFGMRQLESGLQALGNAKIREVLGQSTQNPLASVGAGTLITAIVQSSSMVSLIVLAFASAGMIPLFNAVGVILGANLGTTFTGWIVTTIGFKMDLEALALPMFGLGALAFVFNDKNNRWYHGAQAILGLGLLIFGLSEMKTAVEQLPQYLDMATLESLSIPAFLLIGILMTAVIQSSSAMTMIALTALHSGVIDLSGAAALVIGADLGTTSTTVLGSLRGAPIVKQLALSHLIYNLVVDTLAFLFLLPVLPSVLSWLGITDPLYGLVLFHSSFNFIGLILFVPLLKPYSNWLSKRFLKSRQYVTRFLHNTPANVSDAAIVAMYEEVHLLVIKAMELNASILHLNAERLAGRDGLLTENINLDDAAIQEAYSQLKKLEGAIRHYSVRLEGNNLSEGEVERIANIVGCARDAVYSVKTLKDIRSDLEPGNRLQSVYEQDWLNEQLTALYAAFFETVSASEVQITHLDNLVAQLEQLHADWHTHISESLKQLVLAQADNQELEGYYDSATLLNANRAIWHSNQVMLRAIRILSYSQSTAPDPAVVA